MFLRINKASLHRKAGFVIERNADHWKPPEGLVDSMARKTGRGATYFGVAKRAGGRFVRRWKLMVPPDLVEVPRLD